jgi:hypothetical protein
MGHCLRPRNRMALLGLSDPALRTPWVSRERQISLFSGSTGQVGPSEGEGKTRIVISSSSGPTTPSGVRSRCTEGGDGLATPSKKRSDRQGSVRNDDPPPVQGKHPLRVGDLATNCWTAGRHRCER